MNTSNHHTFMAALNEHVADSSPLEAVQFLDKLRRIGACELTTLEQILMEHIVGQCEEIETLIAESTCA